MTNIRISSGTGKLTFSAGSVPEGIVSSVSSGISSLVATPTPMPVFSFTGLPNFMESQDNGTAYTHSGDAGFISGERYDIIMTTAMGQPAQTDSGAIAFLAS
jgi:hypothetical protein